MSARPKISDSQVKKMMNYISSASTRNKTRLQNATRTGPWAPKFSKRKPLAADVNDDRHDLIEAIMWCILETEGKEEKIKVMKKQHENWKKAKADFEKHSKKDD